MLPTALLQWGNPRRVPLLSLPEVLPAQCVMLLFSAAACAAAHTTKGSCLLPSTLLQVLPAQRQTLLFSATMTRTLTELQSQLLTDAYHFQVRQAQRAAAWVPGCL